MILILLFLLISPNVLSLAFGGPPNTFQYSPKSLGMGMANELLLSDDTNNEGTYGLKMNFSSAFFKGENNLFSGVDFLDFSFKGRRIHACYSVGNYQEELSISTKPKELFNKSHGFISVNNIFNTKIGKITLIHSLNKLPSSIYPHRDINEKENDFFRISNKFIGIINGGDDKWLENLYDEESHHLKTAIPNFFEAWNNIGEDSSKSFWNIMTILDDVERRQQNNESIDIEVEDSEISDDEDDEDDDIVEAARNFFEGLDELDLAIILAFKKDKSKKIKKGKGTFTVMAENCKKAIEYAEKIWEIIEKKEGGYEKLEKVSDFILNGKEIDLTKNNFAFSFLIEEGFVLQNKFGKFSGRGNLNIAVVSVKKLKIPIPFSAGLNLGYSKDFKVSDNVKLNLIFELDNAFAKSIGPPLSRKCGCGFELFEKNLSLRGGIKGRKIAGGFSFTKDGLTIDGLTFYDCYFKKRMHSFSIAYSF